MRETDFNVHIMVQVDVEGEKQQDDVLIEWGEIAN